MMEGIVSILEICFCVGVVIVCVILVGSGILRWLAHRRSKRLNIASWIAFVVLCIIGLVNNLDAFSVLMSEGNTKITEVFINTAKITVKLLMLGAVVGSAIMLLFFIFYFMYGVLGAISKHQRVGGNLSEQFSCRSEEIKNIVKTPIGIFIVTWGILALFVVLPLLMGEKDSPSMAETWKSGVIKISDFANSDVGKYKKPVEVRFEGVYGNDGEDYGNYIIKNRTKGKQSFYNALAGYILIFIIVLGVGFAAVKILYSIIDRTLESKSGKTLLDEYSGSIGVLAVGVALLWTMQERDFLNDSLIMILRDCVMSFAMVIFIVATAIITLEVIRLLMDMREKLIRREARYLFISLVGQVSLLLLAAINSIYEAVSNAIGTVTNNNMDEFYEKMQWKMVETMKEQMEEPAESNKDEKPAFPSFSEKVTKK